MEMPRARLLLRAEIHAEGRVIIGHTTEISVERAFVQTWQRLPVGGNVRLQLSFPGLLEPLLLHARVLGTSMAHNPGDDHGIELEVERDAGLAQLLARLPAAHPRPYRVLLVDDSELIGEMVVHAAGKHFGAGGAVSFDVARSGAEALHKLAGWAYDLAIVDHLMPVMNGAQLVEKLRADPGHAELPVIGISVAGGLAEAQLLAAGADLFVAKPIVLHDLFTTLERLGPGATP